MKNRENLRGFIQIVVILLALVLVAAGAYYFGTLKNSPSTVPIASTQPSPSPVATTDPTSNWKTYTNVKFGFQIQYPSNWSLKEDKSLQNMALITVTAAAPSGETLIDIWVRSGTWSSFENELRAKSTRTTLNGISCLMEFVNATNGGKVYTFPSKNDNQIIQIVYGKSFDSPSEEIKTLDQVLSTFKFTK